MIPLLPVKFSSDHELAQQAFQNEVLSILINELEQELTGRILLSPSYSYLKLTDKTKEINRLNNWIQDARTQPFNHVFFITYDSSWKKDEQDLNGTLLWIPSVKTGDVYSEEMSGFIRDQVDQLVELIRSYW